MKTCCTPGCDNELKPNSRLRTCNNCRAYAHRWDRRRPAERLDYSRALSVRRARMSLFMEVSDDAVSMRDHDALEKKRLITFPVRKSKQKAKSNIVEFKIRNKKVAQ